MALDGLRRLVAALAPSGDITQRAVQSGLWLAGTNVLTRVMLLVRYAVVARIVGIEGMGLFGFAVLALTVVERFSELGLDAALIQREETDVDEYLDTVWVLTLLRGALLAAVLYLAAPFVAAFFDNPAVTPLVRLLALSPLLYGVRNPAVLYFEKDLAFDRRFAFLFTGVLLNTVVAIALAYRWAGTGRAVFALVVGVVVGEATRTVMSYLLHGYRPALAFDLDQAREIIGYGKWITATAILVFLVHEGDDIFVGWFLGEAALGAYQLAYQFANAPATEITSVVSRVVFPTYSKIQGDAHALREGFFRTVTVTTLLSFPAAAGVAVVAPTFVLVVFGAEFAPAIPALQVLAVWGLLRSYGATTGPLFNAVGNPDYVTKIQAAKLVVIAALIYPATARYGIVGTGAAVVVATVVADTPWASYLALRETDGSARRLARALAYPAAGSLVMLGAVYALQQQLATGVLSLVAQVLLGVAVYGACVLVFDRLGYDVVPLLRETVRAARG